MNRERKLRGRAYIGHPDMYYAEVDPATVGEFLATVAGVDVFEGDVYEDHHGDKYTISWDKNKAVWAAEYRGKGGMYYFWSVNDVKRHLRVGTIHDPKPATP